MDRRRASFDWISARDEGDAAAAAAEIADWLAEQRSTRDWGTVLGSLRDALQRLSVHPTLRSDPVARDVLRGLGPVPSLGQIAAAIDALARRADDLAAARAPAGRRSRFSL